MSDTDKFYLETNALYSVNKIKAEYLERAFTSSLAILELIAGLKGNPDRFDKIKSLLQSVANKKLRVDWSLPQSVICFEMFDVSKPHKLIDHRPEILQELVTILIDSDNIDAFGNRDYERFGENGFEYIAKIEDKWKFSLMNSFAQFQNIFKASFKSSHPNTSLINGKTYNTSSKQLFTEAILREFDFTRKATIGAFTRDFLTGPLEKLQLTKDQVVNSYNGQADHFINAFTLYMIQILCGNSPSGNDFVDLQHLTYLRNHEDTWIVSDDKIFDRFFSSKTIKLKDVIN